MTKKKLKYDETIFTAEPFKPYETTITMNVQDIKHITDEDLKSEKPKEEYDKLLLKVYWYLKGLNTRREYEQITELMDMIEDYL